MERGEKKRYDGRCRDRVEAREGVDPALRCKRPGDGEVVVDDRVRGRKRLFLLRKSPQRRLS